VKTISVRTSKRCEMLDITHGVAQCVRESDVKSGVAFVFVPHTTAGVAINENGDPDVKRDVLYELERAVPNTGFAHFEGNSDAHTKAQMTGACAQVIVEDCRLMLGTWQSIYFCEYDGPRARSVYVQVLPAG